MKFRIGLAALALAVAATGFAVANEDIIGLRQQVMKTNGQAAKVSAGMARGEIPFDGAVAAAAMKLIADNLTEFPHLFPVGSEGGKAGAAIWSDPDGFAAAANTTVEAATAAAAAAEQGQEAFGPAFGAVGASCGACHESYRQS